MKLEFNQKQLWELFYILDSRLEGLEIWAKERDKDAASAKNSAAGIKKCKDLLAIIEPNLER
jgi:hypothetical protein